MNVIDAVFGVLTLLAPIFWIAAVFIIVRSTLQANRAPQNPIGYIVKKKEGPGKKRFLIVGPAHGNGYTAWYCDLDKREVVEMYASGMYAGPDDYEVVAIEPTLLYDLRYNYLLKFKSEILYSIDSFNLLYGGGNDDHYNERTFNNIKEHMKHYLYIEELMNKEKVEK